MKAVIFAGGVGTRLWPLSRKKSPKQFEKIIGDRSTLQLAVERLIPEFSYEDIYISTGKAYVNVVAAQLPKIPLKNIFGEPEKKDVGPAVAYMMGCLAKQFPHEPVVILWSDHIVAEENKFKKILKASAKIITKNPDKIIFIGQKPRFASDNLGWIQFGEVLDQEDDVLFHKFDGFKYKPNKSLAEEYFKNQSFCWNLGYFVSTPQFVFDIFKRFSPKIHRLISHILENIGNRNFEKVFQDYYHQMPEINFDNAVLEQLDKNFACVVVDDIGWSDVGAWEALKEALEKKQDDNITKGKIFLENSTDNLIYNYNENKMIVGIDLNDLLVVNTNDVLLISKKTSVSKIKKVVEGFQGTEHEKLT